MQAQHLPRKAEKDKLKYQLYLHGSGDLGSFSGDGTAPAQADAVGGEGVYDPFLPTRTHCSNTGGGSVPPTVACLRKKITLTDYCDLSTTGEMFCV